MADLYDQVRDEPRHIETIENTPLLCMKRGGKFTLPNICFAQVPNRQKLRELMARKYAIPDIDSYFLPLVVDLNTYRHHKGIGSATLEDMLSGTLTPTLGEVSQRGKWFVSFVLAIKGVDETIEHEGVHAAMFHNNPDYRMNFEKATAPQLFREWETHRAWTEAVAWTATNENPRQAIGRYTAKMIQEAQNISLSKFIASIGVNHFLHTARLLKGKSASDMFYKAAELYQGIRTFRVLRAMNYETNMVLWKHAFDRAEAIKEEIGVKGLVAVAQTETVKSVLGANYVTS